MSAYLPSGVTATPRGDAPPGSAMAVTSTSPPRGRPTFGVTLKSWSVSGLVAQARVCVSTGLVAMPQGFTFSASPGSGMGFGSPGESPDSSLTMMRWVAESATAAQSPFGVTQTERGREEAPVPTRCATVGPTRTGISLPAA